MANSTPTSKRCNSRPSKGLRDLEMLHKFLSKKDYREKELNKQFQLLIQKKNGSFS